MKIINNQENAVTFGSLKNGDVFKNYNGYFWIKIQEIGDCEYNAIELEDGDYSIFGDNEEITPLPNARLVID